MEPLEVHLFGGFDVRRAGEAAPPIPSRAGRSLLAYLVVHRDVRHPRERLAALFWPELPAGRARRRVSHVLWQVQDALGELPGDVQYLDATADSITLAPDVPTWVDVEEFERRFEVLRSRRAEGRSRARDLAELQQLVELYRGDFLPGHYDDWVVDEQERLEQRYLEALSWLVSLAKGQGAYDDALLYARRLTNQDPLREDGHREVMRLSMLLGRPSEAIRQFERCREVLGEELGTEPAAATVQLYERIVRQRDLDGNGPAPEPTAFPDLPPLVGRDRERTAAVALLERALAGRGGTVLVEADPGVGKTRLLTEIVDDAHWRGFTALTATARGPEGSGPYAVLLGLLDDVLTPLRVEQLRHRIDPVWLAQVATLLPAARRALPDDVAAPPATLANAEGAQRIRDALVRVVTALTELDPLLIVVDDLQWSDEESLTVLEAVAAHTLERRLVVLLGYRGDEARSRTAVWETLRGIDRASRPERLVLGPLDAAATTELVRVMGRGLGVDPAVATRLRRETGGNPLFVIETLRALAEGQQLEQLRHAGAQLPLPGSIRELVLGRLERLPPELRAVLDTAAVAGDGTDLDILETATELPRSTIADAVDGLLRRSLLRETGDAFGLHHDQIRRAAVTALADGTRRAIHRRLGEAIEVLRPRDVERLAHHFTSAGVTRKAMTYLREAGRAAVAVHAYATADGHYRRAVELQAAGPASVANRYELLAEHEVILDVLGDRARQEATIAEMATLAAGDPSREAETARRQAMLAGQRGDLENGLATAREAVEAAEELGDATLLGSALVTRATMLTWAGRPVEAVPVFERAGELVAEPRTEAEVRVMLGSSLRELQRYDEAADQLERARDLAEEHGEARHAALALGTLGTVRMETGDLAGAEDLYRRAIERCRSIGFRRGEVISLGNRANVLYVSNRVGEALDAYGVALEIAEDLGDARARALALMNRANVRHLVLGDDERARLEVEEALAFFREAGDRRFTAHCLDTLAGIALRSEDADASHDVIRRAFDEALEAGDAWLHAQALHRRAEWHLQAQQPEAAIEDLTEARSLQRADHGFASLEPALLTTEALVHLALERPERAVACTTRAMVRLGPGVERGFLLRHRHTLALEACGRRSEAMENARVAARELEELVAGLRPEDRESARSVVEHQAILERGGDREPRRRVVAVAAADAPVGRPLAPEELVEVAVDLTTGDDAPADPVERRHWLIGRVIDQILAAGGIATVGDLARTLSVSEATVRRDLQALRGAGQELPTRGRRTG